MKKAQGMYFVIAMIIIVILIIAGLKFQLEYKKSLTGMKAKDACHASVLAASTLRFKDFELVNNIECCQENQVVEDPAKAAPTLAKSLYDCYYQFLKGEANLFTGTGKFCFICSSITLEGRAEAEVQGFYQYLLTKKPPLSTKTYATEFGVLERAREAQNVNLANKNYLVLFLHDKQPEAAVPQLRAEEGLIINKRIDDIRSSFILVPQDHELLQQLQCVSVRPCERI